jgi:hypothetical protein
MPENASLLGGIGENSLICPLIIDRHSQAYLWKSTGMREILARKLA